MLVVAGRCSFVVVGCLLSVRCCLLFSPEINVPSRDCGLSLRVDGCCCCCLSLFVACCCLLRCVLFAVRCVSLAACCYVSSVVFGCCG